jgi:hypothetical protein
MTEHNTDGFSRRGFLEYIVAGIAFAAIAPIEDAAAYIRPRPRPRPYSRPIPQAPQPIEWSLNALRNRKNLNPCMREGSAVLNSLYPESMEVYGWVKNALGAKYNFDANAGSVAITARLVRAGRGVRPDVRVNVNGGDAAQLSMCDLPRVLSTFPNDPPLERVGILDPELRLMGIAQNGWNINPYDYLDGQKRGRGQYGGPI